MIPLLDDLPLTHHDDVVSMPDGGESVRDHYGGNGTQVLSDLINGVLHLLLVLLVQGTSGFIKKENIWLLYKCSCDSDSLFLPTRELAASTANVCVDSFGAHLLVNEIPCISSF